MQPGAIDGGQNPADIVATLERFIPLRYHRRPGLAAADQSADARTRSRRRRGGTTNSGCDIVEAIVAISNAAAALFGSQKRVTATAAGRAGRRVSCRTPTAPRASDAAQDVPTNQVDCALASPVNPAMFSDEILQIGKVSGTKPATLGMRVRKYGRTTSYTEGNVTLLNATVNISYNTIAGQKTARFTGHGRHRGHERRAAIPAR